MILINTGLKITQQFFMFKNTKVWIEVWIVRVAVVALKKLPLFCSAVPIYRWEFRNKESFNNLWAENR